MSKVVITDDRPNKSEGKYPASKKKNPPQAKSKEKVQRSTLSLMGHTGVGDNSTFGQHEY